VNVPIAVLASGGGTNLQSLIDSAGPTAGFSVALVISDRADAGALRRAAAHGIPAQVIGVRGRDAGDVAAETLAALDAHAVGFIALAGYLRLVPAEVIRHYEGRIVNIHPALLPAFGGRGMYGMNVHRAVISAGCRVTGATVHRVTEAYDEGGILAQWPVPVLPDDSPELLARRVLAVEHVLYPAVVGALVRGELTRDGADADAHGTASGTAHGRRHWFRLAADAAAAGLDDGAAAGRDNLPGEILRLAGLRGSN
jgi:phosphoribosylglycinamide formyltransferase 1